MKNYNVEFSEVRLIAEKILQSNFVRPITNNAKDRCDMCGHNATVLYDYIDGYSHTRWVCGGCGLLNVPFISDNFRLNNLSKGFLVIDPEKLEITIITNSVNIDKVGHEQVSGINWVESGDDIYASLVRTIASNKSLQGKRYILDFGKRMHQYIYLIKASFGDHLYIAAEHTGLHINTNLIEHIVKSKKLVSVDDITKELKQQLGYLDKPTLSIYLDIIKEGNGKK